ncbi:TRAP transporter substrate-binding protein [Ahrensia kielensis]|uniref:TRAP transporter substrate-binding protein n=1 Tax=Ahrensia kielensis TaxID=76980 RepID=A0ABU9TA50_9HYPH
MKIIRIGALLCAMVSGASAFAGELKLAHFVPPTHPMDQHVMRPMADAFNAAVGGTSEIKIYPAGELGPGPKAQYKRVATGVAELAFVLPDFTSDIFPVLTGYEKPGLFTDGATATEAMWNNVDAIKAEVDRAVPLAFWANNTTILITRDKLVRSPADMAGLKIRIASDNMAQIITAWGGVPVSMSPADAYQAISTGVVDGVYIDPTAFSAYKLYEVTKYATVNIPGSISSFLLAMNLDAYGGLSEEERTALHAASGKELSMKAAAAFAEVGKSALVSAEENGVEMITLTADEVGVFAELSPFKAD